jgi:hypothetical protein
VLTTLKNPVRFIAGSHEYTLTGSKAEINQQVKEIVLSIKKAASIEKADKEFDYIQYTTIQAQPARLFDKYKDRLQHILLGYECAAALEWDKPPVEVAIHRINQYRQYAKERKNPFFLGVALYGMQVVRQRRMVA